MRKAENLGIERSVYDAIRTRRSVRNFKPDKISRIAMRRILEAGRWAPSPENMQMWHFIVVQDQGAIKKFTSSSRHGHFLDKVPCLIVLVINSLSKKDPWLAKLEQDKYAGGAAMQNMMLAAWEIGIGSCWVTIEETLARKVFAIPKYRFVPGALALGYPQGPLMSHGDKDRVALDDLVYYGQFGRKK